MRFRPEVVHVPESPLVRIATIAERMPGSLKLCYGEPDTATPEFICRAAEEAARAGHTFYTYTGGSAELREAIAGQFHRLHGVEYRASEVMATIGATAAIFLAVRALVGGGDNAVIITPAYGIFHAAVTLAGGQPRQVPLARERGEFRLDVDRVRSAIDSRTRMLILNSPSNPTGWTIDRTGQEALWDLAMRHDLVVLSDEVYDRLTFDSDIAPSLAAVATRRDRLIVVNSFSKTYNMTGWRLGYALADERATALMTSAAEFVTSSPPAMIQQAGIAAIDGGEEWVARLRERYRRRRHLVLERLRAISRVEVPEPAGAFYAFVEIEGLEDSEALAERLVRETGVALAPGSAFGPGGEGFLRLCFASEEDVLEEALDRFARFLAT